MRDVNQKFPSPYRTWSSDKKASPLVVRSDGLVRYKLSVPLCNKICTTIPSLANNYAKCAN